MRRRQSAILVVLTTMLLLVPSSALADSGAQTYDLVATAPNFGVAANGDRVEVTGSGTFSIHPKSVSASGSFTHRDSGGAVVGGGTWTATELLAFHSYGCGVLTFPDPDITIPANLCGGILKLRVELVTPVGTFDGILTVFCIIGEHAPASHTFPSPGEGVTLSVPGVINFNHTDGGMNVFIRTS
jgi:hypothetical protein